MGMFYHYDLEDSEVFVFDDFLINQIKEGVKIQSHHNEELKVVLSEHFKNRPIAYISNRVMSYAVDPLVYKETEKIPNLVAMAIIPKTEAMRKNAEYERQFFGKPYEIFDNLSEAIAWVHKLITNENEKIKLTKSN